MPLCNISSPTCIQDLGSRCSGTLCTRGCCCSANTPRAIFNRRVTLLNRETVRSTGRTTTGPGRRPLSSHVFVDLTQPHALPADWPEDFTRVYKLKSTRPYEYIYTYMYMLPSGYNYRVCPSEQYVLHNIAVIQREHLTGHFRAIVSAFSNGPTLRRVQN